MLEIVAVIIPLIVVVSIGYGGARLRLVAQTSIKDISRLTFNLIIPLYLFHSIATANLDDNVSTGTFFSFYGGVTIVYGLAALLSFAVFRKQSLPVSPSVFALGATYSNTIIVGLPVLVSMFGNEVAATVFIIISFHSALLFFATSLLNQVGSKVRFDFKSLASSTLFNPLLIGIFSGLIINLSGIGLNDWISKTLKLFTAPALTLSLLILGASLNQFRITSNLSTVFMTSITKLLVLPSVVLWIAATQFQLDSKQVLILVLLTACPTGVNAFLVASQQKSGEAVIAGTVVLSTLMSAVTIPLWIMALNNLL